MSEVTLGSLIRDKVSGIKGIVVGRTLWLHGCPRLNIQPQGENDKGGPIDMFSIDEPQAELIENNKVPEGDHLTGGDPRLAHQKETTRKV